MQSVYINRCLDGRAHAWSFRACFGHCRGVEQKNAHAVAIFRTVLCMCSCMSFLFIFMVVVGLPHCRASQLYTVWPLAWTGFHVSYSVFIIGPPALSGFPYTHNKTSCIHRFPCVCRSLQWASRIVGLPSRIQYGLRHGPASMYLTVYLSSGLPLCRASLIHTIRHPAYTGFHVHVDPGSGPPALSGFPMVYKMASGMDRLACILQCIYHRASPLCQSSLIQSYGVVLAFVRFCHPFSRRLHCQPWSQRARSSVALTSLLAKSRAARCA